MSIPTLTDRPTAAGFRVTRWSRSSIVGTSLLAVVVVVLAALPYLVGLATIQSLVSLFILVILASTWNLLAGYGGMLSIGQQAYIGIGAYGLVLIADLVGLDPFLAVPVAALIAALVSIPISFLAFRLVGGYFAIGTWVIAEVLRLTVSQVPELGAGSGISLSALSGLDRILRIATVYWWALAVLVIVVVACVLFARSRGGLALTAVRDDPVAAATSGIDVQRSKRIVFVAAAAGAGAAGALLALSTLRVQPNAVFSVEWSAFMIFIVLIGGLGTLEGPLIGAIVFFVLRESLADYGSTYLIVLGVLGVLFVLFARRGLWGLVQRRWDVSLFPTGYRLAALDAGRPGRRR